MLRGAITKKKREILGKIPKGGGLKKNRQKFPISIWEFEKPRNNKISDLDTRSITGTWVLEVRARLAMIPCYPAVKVVFGDDIARQPRN